MPDGMIAARIIIPGRRRTMSGQNAEESLALELFLLRSIHCSVSPPSRFFSLSRLDPSISLAPLLSHTVAIRSAFIAVCSRRAPTVCTRHCTARADLKVTRLTCIPARTSLVHPRLPPLPPDAFQRLEFRAISPVINVHARRGCSRRQQRNIDIAGAARRGADANASAENALVLNVVDMREWARCGEGMGEKLASVKGGTARYFRAMHFSTESRVHAADVLTDAENAGRATVIYYTCTSFRARLRKNVSNRDRSEFRPRGKKTWLDAALIYRVSIR